MNLRTKVRAGVVSTVKLPFTHPGGDYETCVFFAGGESEVVERYESPSEASAGHERHVQSQGGARIL